MECCCHVCYLASGLQEIAGVQVSSCSGPQPSSSQLQVCICFTTAAKAVRSLAALQAPPRALSRGRTGAASTPAGGYNPDSYVRCACIAASMPFSTTHPACRGVLSMLVRQGCATTVSQQISCKCKCKYLLVIHVLAASCSCLCAGFPYGYWHSHALLHAATQAHL